MSRYWFLREASLAEGRELEEGNLELEEFFEEPRRRRTTIYSTMGGVLVVWPTG